MSESKKVTMVQVSKSGVVTLKAASSEGTSNTVETVQVANAVNAVNNTILVKEETSTTEEVTSATVPSGAMVVKAETGDTTEASSQVPQQQIYIIQTGDGTVPMESAEVVVADDMAVYETVSALEQLSRGQVVTTSDGGEQLIQVYEEVVLPDGATVGGGGGGAPADDQYVDVAEVEVGDGRSASPVKIDTAASIAARLRQSSTSDREDSPQGEYHICRICSHFVPISEIAEHNREQHGAAVSELTCTECGKLFKSKRSLFGHKKEKHSGVTEVHTCPECGKTFGRKSNLKAHRESLHYGKKFPCQFCERIFTNRSSMNQHIKKTHSMPQSIAENLML